MVVALYLFLLIPVVAYLVFSVMEIWLTFLISTKKRSKSLLFIQSSMELTHTLLVFAYAQFMVTFSALLVEIGALLWWPIALLMVTILLRGSLYLLMFYREHSRRIEYVTLLATYLVGVLALLWFLAILIPAIVTRQFVPDVSNMPIVLAFGVPALAIALIPLVLVYRNAIKQLRSK